MKIRRVTGILFAALIALWALTGAPAAQQRVNPNSNTERGGVEVKQVPGHKIGNVTTKGNLVLLELDEGAIGSQNLFDLDKRTVRFTVTITIQDVIAHNGPRVPSFENSPKAYNTGIVAVTLHGRHPGDAMLAQLEGIATA